MQPIRTDTSPFRAWVELTPDQGNIFIAERGGMYFVAKTVIVSGIPLETVSAVEQGDISTLSSFLVADSEEPHVYHLVDCKGAVNTDTQAANGIDSFSEFRPVVPVKTDAR